MIMPTKSNALLLWLCVAAAACSTTLCHAAITNSTSSSLRGGGDRRQRQLSDYVTKDEHYSYGLTGRPLRFLGMKCAVNPNAGDYHLSFQQGWKNNLWFDSDRTKIVSWNIGSSTGNPTYFTHVSTNSAKTGYRSRVDNQLRLYSGHSKDESNYIKSYEDWDYEPEYRWPLCIKDGNTIIAACWLGRSDAGNTDLLSRMGTPSRESVCCVPGQNCLSKRRELLGEEEKDPEEDALFIEQQEDGE